MTVFYIILMYVWKYTFPELNAPVAVEAMIWISAIIRIIVCLFPQNNWTAENGNMKLSIEMLFCSNLVLGADYSLGHFWKHKRISHDENGCSNYYFFWMLSPSNIIQQNKTKGRAVNDTKDLCLYVGHCNGTSAFITDNHRLLIENFYVINK